MISKIKTIDEVTPIFKDYMKHMSQFFEISNYDSWCDGGLKNLQLYSTKQDRHIYILSHSKSIIGFAFVNKHLRFFSDGSAIAEFFIQKQYQGNGFGRKLAQYVFSQFPGNWEIAVTFKNKSARSFWQKVVSSYTSGDFIEKQNALNHGFGFLFNNA